MTDTPSPEKNLADEFRSLGRNLSEALRSAWESPERKDVQQQIEGGLSELGNTLQREHDNFVKSPAGQQFKSEIEEIGQRFQSGEAQAAMRQELLEVLQAANSGLKNLIDKWGQPKTDSPHDETKAEEDKAA